MNIGDTVRFLNSTGGGIVRRIDGQMAYVEDEDGFEIPALVRECVVVGQPATQAQTSKTAPKTPAGKATPESRPHAITPAPAPEHSEIEETPGGDRLNLIMAFAASDLKRLSNPSTSFDLFLVNDSNYFIAYTIATRDNYDTQWNPLAQGLLEPNMQEFIIEITRDMIPAMDRLALQYITFKQGRPYELKAPGAIDIKLHNDNFSKLHCYRPSDFFDEPVIEKVLVKDDIPVGKHSDTPLLSPEELRHSMMEKKRLDRRSSRPVNARPAQSSTKASSEPIVTDLHITELVDSTRGLSNADMLNLQIDRFRQVMDANLRRQGQKLIFIHGKGEGVLRAAIIKELNYRYKGHDVQDASFREYGFGATQVTIR